MYFLYLLNTLLFSFTVVQGKAKYSTSQEGMLGCTLATPPIYYTENGTFLNLSKIDIEELTDAVKENAVFRIGYVQKYVVFVYRGCVQSSQIISTKFDHIQNSAGRCYTRCGTEFVGLQGNTCHCISDVPRSTLLHQRGCNKSCSVEIGSLCGGINLVSLYMKVSDLNLQSPGQNQPQGNVHSCLSFAKYQTRSLYNWESCSTSYEIVCLKVTDQHILKVGFGPWAKASQACWENSSLPMININTTQLIPEGGSPKWTEFIRSSSIVTGEMDKSGQHWQGYVKFTRDSFQLTFDRGIMTMNTLCNLRILGTTTSGYGPQSSKNALSRMSTFKSTRYVRTSAIQSTKTHSVQRVSTTHSVSAYHGVTEANSKSSSSYKVILYTIIPVSLVIILGAVGFILWRRRSLPFCRQPDVDFDETMSTTTANTKLESEPNSEAQQHDYFVLEPQGNYDSIKYIKEHARTEDNCDRASSFTYNYALSVTNNSTGNFKEDDYDTTTTVSKPSVNACAMSSVYDKFDYRDTYNHIGEVKGMHAKLDDTYNHLEPKKSEMYDTTSTISKPGTVVDNGDDMYSKVLEKKGKY